MIINIYPDKLQMGAEAAKCADGLLKQAIDTRGSATLVLATGASQLEMLSYLVKSSLDWSKVTVFHLDEYIGLPITHPASFRRYLKERFEKQVTGLYKFHYIDGEIDPQSECQKLGELLNHTCIDVACIGIGENGHLAFNDPPADFKTAQPYIIVDLDTACRQQQVGEGWFTNLAEVPKQAISMGIRQIMKSDAIVCTVPDTRKANAVKKTIEGPVTNWVPASILQTHSRCWLYLDEAAAGKLNR
jgi:glucosamine-6-phosphate deaminase